MFAAPIDDNRTGIIWNDLQLGDGAVRVLGESRETSTLSFPNGLRQHWSATNALLNPPTDEWPIFPSAHAPSKYRAVREQLAERIPDDEVETIRDDQEIDTVLREYERSSRRRSRRTALITS